MTFAAYMKANIGEWLLVVLTAGAVAVVGLNGFYLDSLLESIGYALRAAMAFAGVALCVSVLYAVSYRRGSMVFGVVAYIAVLAIMLAIAFAFSSGESVYADEEGNYFYFVVTVAVSATSCFLLTRTLTGCAVWLVAVSLTCSVVEAFYQSGETLMSMVAVFAAFALIIHRNFRHSLERAESASKPSHARNFMASVVPVLAVGAVSVVVWVAILAPLDPGTASVKLITEYRLPPIVEMKGTAQEWPILNYDMTTQNLVEGFPYTTDDPKEDSNSTVIIDMKSLLEQQLVQEVNDVGAGTGSDSGGGNRETFDQESPDPEWDPISWSVRFPWIIVVLAVLFLLIAAIVAYFVGRRIWRTRRLRKMLALPSREQVGEMYRFILERLRRMGNPVPAGMTLAGFAKANARNLESMTDETRIPLEAITDVYQACEFGKLDPVEDDVALLAAYYLSFWKGARSYLGNFRYFFKSFRL